MELTGEFSQLDTTTQNPTFDGGTRVGSGCADAWAVARSDTRHAIRYGESMSRIVTRLSLGFCALALCAFATACGTEEQAVETTTATLSENPSAPVVAGPSPRPTSDTTQAQPTDDRECGTTSGPDGALRVLITDGTVSCEEAMALAAQYGPMIATGRDQMVDGWECGPSDDAGVLAKCERDNDATTDDDDEINFAP